MLITRGAAELYLANISVPGHFEPTRFAGLLHDDLTEPDGGPDDTSDPATRFALRLPAIGRLEELTGEPADRHTRYIPIADIPVGTQLVRTGPGSRTDVLGSYRGRRSGWEPHPGFPTATPARWGLKPAHPVGTIHRGIRATYDGTDFDTDLGPGPARLTLAPAEPGTPPLTVSIAECDRVRFYRATATWQGERFEMLDSRHDAVTLVYLAGDEPTARRLALTETTPGVWRTNVPHASITDMTVTAIDLDPPIT
ncbi:hypothetical protein [Actinomadura rubrisoli]|uniref:Uncharacterized protein n=1 Tax=Actinomadura rubrisoli TaxID=2530368 RepID=A0A4R5CAY9_9ACTN|nr:hypothetical protein [Actinomadura rubrisoli]TDD95363.1 hypothetical protein E1298_05160 [Actinomadura rubrisoli]